MGDQSARMIPIMINHGNVDREQTYADIFE